MDAISSNAAAQRLSELLTVTGPFIVMPIELTLVSQNAARAGIWVVKSMQLPTEPWLNSCELPLQLPYPLIQLQILCKYNISLVTGNF